MASRHERRTASATGRSPDVSIVRHLTLPAGAGATVLSGPSSLAPYPDLHGTRVAPGQENTAEMNGLPHAGPLSGGRGGMERRRPCFHGHLR